MIPVAVHCIRGTVDRAEAEALAASASPSSRFEAASARRLYYPYHWLLFRESVETFLGPSAVRISCLVDARRGLGATVDPFECEITRVGSKDVLPCSITEERALSIGRRVARQAPRVRRRALVAPRREVLERRLVYKPFWVVTANGGGNGAGGRAESILVDGVTGCLHPLFDSSTRALV